MGEENAAKPAGRRDATIAFVDDEDDFRRAMAGVKPLAADGPSTVLRSRQTKKVQPPRERGGRFDIERIGERVEGLAHGSDRQQLHRLQRVDLHIEVKLDLHGHSEDAAKKAVEEAVERAYAAGQRCLLVIHGRGRRSPAGPVLKEALPEWLTGPRCAARVLAFTSAPADLGGAGAMLVLLRRQR